MMPGLHIETDGNNGDNTVWQEKEHVEVKDEDEDEDTIEEGAASWIDAPVRKPQQERNAHDHFPSPSPSTTTITTATATSMTKRTPSSSSSSLATDPFPDLEASSATPTPTSNPKSNPIGSPKKTRTQSNVTARRDSHESVRKLSASQMQALTSAPESLPIAIVPPTPTVRKPNGIDYPMSASVVESSSHMPISMAEQMENGPPTLPKQRSQKNGGTLDVEQDVSTTAGTGLRRPASIRTLSTPPINRRTHTSSTSVPIINATRRNSFNPLARPAPLNLTIPPPASARAPSKSSISSKAEPPESSASVSTSTIVPPIPLPPMSLPTHLQLELAGQRPSPLYIYQSHKADAIYESSAVKFERLLNMLLLPPYLERLLIFGALACFDAWLYTFTILPMRFCIALWVLIKWWCHVIWKETRWLFGFVWEGVWRLRRRARKGKLSRTGVDNSDHVSETERSRSRPRGNSAASHVSHTSHADSTATTVLDTLRPKGNGVLHPPKHPMRPLFRHRRTKSTPSDLTHFHKADLLQGAIIICSSLALINLDASRIYHFIRAQSSMKLYVIYNILEVGDRLLAAIGQDVIECLFSSETLSRNSSGRSKILLPFGMFVLSLIYNVIHVLCLFYQVITLNVAVNSYSNTLLTLLISNQFVEIKGAVFKKIEKENLFQLTCADVVERFQLWVILLIIGMRNIIEMGGLSVPGAGGDMDNGATGPGPIHTNSILPHSFTVWPSWLFSGEVLSPFFVVIGIEMMVDWIKHAYINKFNNVRPVVYDRMLDILCKDYYTNAFGTPSLTRRVGLPVLPLSCLFIRASMQIYHMFLSTYLPPPIPTSTMELSVESSSSTPSSPAMVAALERLDTIIRNALGRSVHGDPLSATTTNTAAHAKSFWALSSDDAIALLTMLLFFFLAWMVLLIVKLVLGMVLLRYARRRYAVMVHKEQQQQQQQGGGGGGAELLAQPGSKRIGPWGATEVGDDRRRWLYDDDPDGLRRMRERERKTEEKFRDGAAADDGLGRVFRYEMGVSKRIW